MSKGKERLRHRIQQEFKSINKQILDLAELVVSQEQYPQFRKKILNITNDVRRNIEQDLDLNYDVSYDPATICEDVVIVGQGKHRIDKNRKGLGNDGKDRKGNK